MKPEEKVKAKVRALLKSYGPALYYFMPRGTSMGQAGVPDFIICYKGRMIGVETKATEKNKPTELQLRNHEKIRKAGGVALVIHDGNVGALAAVLRSL